ncbi:MAG: tetratricopeptide repeat protein [Anaerolineae bacterium]|nr:tetratricopeptide repeat protein [Anaerolineae bacterium]MBN8618042.1 tetratricopeptide repeat protein [Anaerolineae bacterium]
MPSRTTRKESGPQPNREELLQMGIRAAKSGNNDGARIFFEQVLGQDRRNERAMMWMAKITTDNKAERKKWLERVLEVNPDNQQAKDALKKIVYKKTANENRTLLLFGVVAGVLIVLAIVVVAGILIFNR